MEKDLNKNKKDNFNKETNNNLSRRSFLKRLAMLAAGSTILGTAGIYSYLENKDDKKEEKQEQDEYGIDGWGNIDRKHIESNEYKKLKPELEFEYKEIYPDLKIHNLKMLGTVGKYGTDTEEGKILRTLRFQNITTAVEKNTICLKILY